MLENFPANVLKRLKKKIKNYDDDEKVASS